MNEPIVNENNYKGWFIGEPFFSDNCWKIHASKEEKHLYGSEDKKEDCIRRMKYRIDDQERIEELKSPFKSTRQQILEDAIQCVTKDRNATYGYPEDNFKVIAQFWNDYLISKWRLNQPIVDTKDVSVMMILMKISRIITSPEHLDHWVDIAGYAGCGGEIAMKKKISQEKAADKAAGMELPK